MSALRAAKRRQAKDQEREERKKTQKRDAVTKAREEGFINGYDASAKYTSAEVVRMCTTAFIATIQNEYGLGKIRLERLLDLSMATFKQFQEDPKHEEKLRKNLLRKYSVDLDAFTGCGKLDQGTIEFIPQTITREQSSDLYKQHMIRDNQGAVMDAVVSNHMEKAATNTI